MTDTAHNDFQKLVYARILAMPDSTVISIGGDQNLTKREILHHVESNDDIGKKFIEIEREFFQTLKEGTLYAYEA
jgi:hypothetical protein